MKYQVMPDLTPIEYEALKADIAEHGILVPVEVDEDGELLDGHHRVKAWQELTSEGIALADYPRMIRRGWTEEEKRNHARRLNVLRRQLTKEQREQVMVDMRRDGMSYRQIAEAVGVSVFTAHEAIKNTGVSNLTPVVNGADGKTYPATQERKPAPPQQSIFDPGGSVEVKPQAHQPYRGGATAYNNLIISDTPGYDGDEWYTPIEIIEAARRVLGEIDLDPATCQAAQEQIQAKNFYTKDDDSLRDDCEWFGRVWINPPYSMPLIRQFVTKLIAQFDAGNVKEAIIITNNSSDTSWFHALLERFPACFTFGRTPFWRPNHDNFGTRQGQTIFYLGDSIQAFRQAFSEIGRVVTRL